MSTVYFHSPSDSAELRGTERARFGALVTSIGLAALGVSDMFGDDDIAAALRANVAEISLRFPDGSLHNIWHLLLNTCLAIGGEPLQFAARLHAQCEVHGWIAAEDRAWLASVIEAGRASGLYRAGVGWEHIVKFLRACPDEPVVLSYSVCDSFPNPEAADAEDHDAWYELPRTERWATAWAKLRERDDLRIKPEGVLFGAGINAFQARDEVTGWSRRWQRAQAAEGDAPAPARRGRHEERERSVSEQLWALIPGEDRFSPVHDRLPVVRLLRPRPYPIRRFDELPEFEAFETFVAQGRAYALRRLGCSGVVYAVDNDIQRAEHLLLVAESVILFFMWAKAVHEARSVSAQKAST